MTAKHFGRPPQNLAESNVTQALRNYYTAQVELHRLQKKTPFRYRLNSEEIQKAYRTLRDATIHLGQTYAYHLGDEFAIEYRIWAHDNTHDEHYDLPTKEAVK